MSLETVKITVVGIGFGILLLGIGIKTDTSEKAVWYQEHWECPSRGEELIYFDGLHQADSATYEHAQTARSDQVWCEKEQSILLVFLYNFGEGTYLRHLDAKEAALLKKALAVSEDKCPDPEKNATKRQFEQQMDSFIACTGKFAKDFQMVTDEVSAIHQRRLRLDVKWGIAESTEDAKELGWNYPRAIWDGHQWDCPEGAAPYSIEAEKQAGADEYVHCLSEKEAKQLK